MENDNSKNNDAVVGSCRRCGYAEIACECGPSYDPVVVPTSPRTQIDHAGSDTAPHTLTGGSRARRVGFRVGRILGTLIRGLVNLRVTNKQTLLSKDESIWNLGGQTDREWWEDLPLNDNDEDNWEGDWPR